MATDAENLASARTKYFANADWAETGDVTKARAFSTAIRMLMAFPESSVSGHQNARFNLQQLREELTQVMTWLKQNGGIPTPSTTGGMGRQIPLY